MPQATKINNSLKLPTSKPRVPPLPRSAVDAYVKTEYDKSVNTWGIPNNLIRTMAWLPRLALTEVDYANSFIFDEGPYASWPTPSTDGSATVGTTLFPYAGFVDRVTKELVINLVSLLNRSRYSITHHTVIGLTTLSRELPGISADEKSSRAEAMLYHLVDTTGKPDFENRTDAAGKPLYTELHLHALRLAATLQRSAHEVSDQQFDDLRTVLRAAALAKIAETPALAAAPASKTPEYVQAYVNGMLVELTWCIVHFNGLLNNWFTVLRVMDEVDANTDGIDFVTVYNTVVPDRIKVRNNNLLGETGWGR